MPVFAMQHFHVEAAGSLQARPPLSPQGRGLAGWEVR